MYPDVTICIQVQQRERNETNIGDFLLATGPLNRLQSHAEFCLEFLHRVQLLILHARPFFGTVQHRADHTGV